MKKYKNSYWFLLLILLTDPLLSLSHLNGKISTVVILHSIDRYEVTKG